jgi:hypothetical protein
MVLTNTLAYCNTELVTAVKIFIEQSLFNVVIWHEIQIEYKKLDLSKSKYKNVGQVIAVNVLKHF